jgi:uncharacterized small protein (DUF1192 family)
MAFEFEDLEPQKKAKKPTDLSSWSIEELTDYIAALEAEIGRAQETIAARKKHMSGAESLFKR